MPSVEKLYEKLKDRPDVVVLTMSVDEKPDQAKAYAEQKGFQFPVLLAYKFVREQLETKGIPRNWVFDRSMVFRTDEIGYQKNNWLENMTINIDRAAR